eukprot:10376375-Ditylum_brightwellii.AAC.2
MSAWAVMDQIQSIYTIKFVGPPKYYLGNDFKKDSKNRQHIGCKDYISEAIKYVQSFYDVLLKHDRPMVPGDHPEMDDSQPLVMCNTRNTRCCLKKPNWRIRVDLCNPIVVKNGAEPMLEVDLSTKLKDQYHDAQEHIDKKVPTALLNELAITAYVDSNHAHDKITQRSITGLITFVGRTPMMFI